LKQFDMMCRYSIDYRYSTAPAIFLKKYLSITPADAASAAADLLLRSLPGEEPVLHSSAGRTGQRSTRTEAKRAEKYISLSKIWIHK
jgi:hypothetical protein